MIKVGITGQKGFIGSHLFNHLGLKEDISLIEFERKYFSNKEKLQKFVLECDYILHLAAMNRSEDEQLLYQNNLRLVQQLIDACTLADSKPVIIFSSSTQEAIDNPYGKSKLEGGRLLREWADKSGGCVKTLIIPNVFGPFGRPNYNSFIATFCHQIINGKEPKLLSDSEVNLIYINELAEQFYTAINNNKSSEEINVAHTTTQKVSQVLMKIKQFKSEYVEEGKIPELKTDFDLNLFNTFVTFLPKDFFPRKYVKHSDDRGSFVELMRANTKGQCSFSTTKSGITRGNHFHTRKIERFAVIKGKAKIQWRKINDDKVYNFILDGEDPAYVDMPIWYTHNITNIGTEELVTIFWINEAYNPDDPDTYYVNVELQDGES